MAVPLPRLAAYGRRFDELRELAVDDHFAAPLGHSVETSVPSGGSDETLMYQTIQRLLQLRLVYPVVFDAVDELLPVRSVLSSLQIPGNPARFLSELEAAVAVASDSVDASPHVPREELGMMPDPPVLPAGTVNVCFGVRDEPTDVQNATIVCIMSDEVRIESEFLELLDRDLRCDGEAMAAERFGKRRGEASYLPLDLAEFRDAIVIDALLISPAPGRWAVLFRAPWNADDEHGDWRIACVEYDRFAAVWPGEWMDASLWLSRPDKH